MGKHRRRKWRLYTFLSAMGAVSSKSEAGRLARAGSITVDGNIMKSLDYQVNPRKQEIRIDGKHIELKENRKYYAFNKPIDVICTKKEIIEFFDVPQDIKKSLAPVGQLDKNSTGLLIVTNDGRLGRMVLLPKTKRWKTYEVKLDKEIDEESIARLEKGVEIETEINGRRQKYLTMPAKVKKVGPRKIHVSIMEGKKHQVKKMVTKAGCWVESLRRISIAKLKLGNIKPGEYREYSKEEIYPLLFE